MTASQINLTTKISPEALGKITSTEGPTLKLWNQVLQRGTRASASKQCPGTFYDWASQPNNALSEYLPYT